MVHPFGGAGLWYPRGQSSFPETVVVVVLNDRAAMSVVDEDGGRVPVTEGEVVVEPGSATATFVRQINRLNLRHPH